MDSPEAEVLPPGDSLPKPWFEVYHNSTGISSFDIVRTRQLKGNPPPPAGGTPFEKGGKAFSRLLSPKEAA